MNTVQSGIDGGGTGIIINSSSGVGGGNNGGVSGVGVGAGGSGGSGSGLKAHGISKEMMDKLMVISIKSKPEYI